MYLYHLQGQNNPNIVMLIVGANQSKKDFKLISGGKLVHLYYIIMLGQCYIIMRV